MVDLISPRSFFRSTFCEGPRNNAFFAKWLVLFVLNTHAHSYYAQYNFEHETHFCDIPDFVRKYFFCSKYQNKNEIHLKFILRYDNVRHTTFLTFSKVNIYVQLFWFAVIYFPIQIWHFPANHTSCYNYVYRQQFPMTPQIPDYSNGRRRSRLSQYRHG